MILPTKHIPVDHTLLWAGMEILKLVRQYPHTISELWKRVKTLSAVKTYQRFILTLDMLYVLGLISFKENKIMRSE